MKRRVGMCFTLVTCLVCSMFQSLGQQPKPKKHLSSDEVLEFIGIPEVEGEHLKVFLTVYEDFRRIADLPKSKKRLENYGIIFKQDDDNIYVHFIPKPETSLHRENGRIIFKMDGDNEFGRDILYAVRRKDLKIINKDYPAGKG